MRATWLGQPLAAVKPRLRIRGPIRAVLRIGYERPRKDGRTTGPSPTHTAAGSGSGGAVEGSIGELGIAGPIPPATGLLGWCPIHSLFGAGAGESER